MAEALGARSFALSSNLTVNRLNGQICESRNRLTYIGQPLSFYQKSLFFGAPTRQMLCLRQTDSSLIIKFNSIWTFSRTILHMRESLLIIIEIKNNCFGVRSHACMHWPLFGFHEKKNERTFEYDKHSFHTNNNGNGTQEPCRPLSSVLTFSFLIPQ